MVRVRHKAAADHCCGTTAGNGAKHICVGILKNSLMCFFLMKLHRKTQIPSNRGSRNSSRVNPTPVTELPKCWSTASSTCAYCKKAGHWETLVPKGVSKVCKSLQPLQYASYWLPSLTPIATLGLTCKACPREEKLILSKLRYSNISCYSSHGLLLPLQPHLDSLVTSLWY